MNSIYEASSRTTTIAMPASSELILTEEIQTPSTSLPNTLTSVLEALDLPLNDGRRVEAVMRSLILTGCASLPLPAHGQTRQRWKALAQVGMTDLALAKIFESHMDALAILAELGQPEENGEALLAVWASEAPSNPLRYSNENRVSGEKKWCSGACFVDAGLVTALNDQDEALLLRVEMQAPGVRIETSPWIAEGMRAADTAAIHFEETPAVVVGGPNDYLQRPGFWHGGAGVAAVWYGAAVAIAQRLGQKASKRSDPHALAKWGAVDSQLMAVRALLLQTADAFDREPETDGCAAALRLRALVESLAHDIIRQATTALGPGPMVTEAEFSRRCADLQIFIRQCHAERDLEALGQTISPEESYLW